MTKEMRSNWVPEVATHQGGVFTTPQAKAAGLSQGAIDYRISTGQWQKVAGRGMCGARQPIGPPQAAWALHLTWPDAIVWGPSAVALWLPEAPLPKTGQVFGALTTARRSSYRLTARKTAVDPEEISTLRGLPVQDLPGALADSLVTLPAQASRSLFAWVVSRGQFPQDRFALAVNRRGRRAGVRLLNHYVKMAASEAASEAELEFHLLLEANGVTGWQANAKIKLIDGRLIRVDLLFEDQHLVVEIDGWAFHSTREAFQQDRSIGLEKQVC